MDTTLYFFDNIFWVTGSSKYIKNILPSISLINTSSFEPCRLGIVF